MRTEILAGITTFFAMAYILVVNPQILSAPFVIRGQAVYAEQVANGVFFATCLIAFIGTLLMAVYAKVPFAQAPGMGLNAFFAYTVVLGMGYSYQQALAMVFISGLLFIFITAIGFREACVRAIPQPVKAAMSAGIGLFLALIGLENASIVISNGATFVGMIDFSLWNDTGDAAGMVMAGGVKYPVAEYHRMIASAIVALIGLVVIGVLFARRVRGAIFIGILVSTLIGIPFGLTALHDFSFNLVNQMQDFLEISLFNMDFAGLFRNASGLFEMVLTIIMIVISFSLVDMFDTIGTLYGACSKGNLLDENGTPIRMEKMMLADAIATCTGAIAGTSTVTTFVESSSGVAAGGRTGFTALVTGLCFIVAMFLSPIAQLIPRCATATALIWVGVLMMSSVTKVDWSDAADAIVAFMTFMVMLLGYSISKGIGMGIITFMLVKICTGKIKLISVATWVIGVIFLVTFLISSV